MEAALGFQGGLSGNKKNKGEDGAPDGPARVVKPGDWGAVPDQSMRGFAMEAFAVPGRVQPKANQAEARILEMAKEARRAEDAHKKALQKAIQEGQEAARQALMQGREEGLREGETKAWKKYEAALGQLQVNARAVLESFTNARAGLFLEFEGQALELAAACIRKVLDGIADKHIEAVLPLLKKAVAALGEAVTVTIKVHPDDFATVKDNQPFWLPVDAGLKDIRIVPDKRIERGGCFVESDSTSVDLHMKDLAGRIEEELSRVFAGKVQNLKAGGSADGSSDDETLGNTGVTGHPGGDEV